MIWFRVVIGLIGLLMMVALICVLPLVNLLLWIVGFWLWIDTHDYLNDEEWQIRMNAQRIEYERQLADLKRVKL